MGSYKDPEAGLRVLIVEDEFLVAMEIETYLNHAGHEAVGMAATLKEAVARARETLPDFALVDIGLAQGSSGLDVASEFREMGIPCLFVSGTCPDPKIACRLGLGCLSKPFNETILLQSLGVALESSKGEHPNKVPPGLLLYEKPSEGGALSS